MAVFRVLKDGVEHDRNGAAEAQRKGFRAVSLYFGLFQQQFESWRQFKDGTSGEKPTLNLPHAQAGTVRSA